MWDYCVSSSILSTACRRNMYSWIICAAMMTLDGDWIMRLWRRKDLESVRISNTWMIISRDTWVTAQAAGNCIMQTQSQATLDSAERQLLCAVLRRPDLNRMRRLWRRPLTRISCFMHICSCSLESRCFTAVMRSVR